MGGTHDALTDEIRAFLERQPVYFVATAPLAREGKVNLSPKGLPSFAVLDAHTVAYLDLTGSGAETVAHVRENGRIVLMFCAFEGDATIVRLHGQGTVLELGDAGFDDLLAKFPPHPGTRSIIRVAVSRISESCGFGVPLMRYEGTRPELRQWAEGKGPEGMRAYREKKNRVSIDGLPAIRGSRSDPSSAG